MNLPNLWFWLVAVFWTGFFVLEGFDFGVGVLHRFIGRTDVERRVAINAIGPFWDGNEVWLIVGGAAIFAAFPTWYATWFSASYLALVLILLALMARGVSFEFRGRVDSQRWRSFWSWSLVVGSGLAPLLFGIALGDLLAGIPINNQQDFTGNFWDLFTPYGVFVGVTLLALTLVHGATFLSIRTTGSVRDRAHVLGIRLSWIAAAVVVGFAIWTPLRAEHVLVRNTLPPALAAIGMLAAAVLIPRRREGLAFAATAAAVGLTTMSIFTALFPDVLVSSTAGADNLTISSTASGHYALQVMTIVALIFTPLVLAYQSWTYVVFRRRIGAPVHGAPSTPARTTPQQRGAPA
jgi:cytochrome d ubiquinol oxidase subunit II